jgi:hypothetical protein
MNVTNKLYRKAFGTEVMRPPMLTIHGDQPTRAIHYGRETDRNFSRDCDGGDTKGPFERGSDKSQPDKTCGL